MERTRSACRSPVSLYEAASRQPPSGQPANRLSPCTPTDSRVARCRPRRSHLMTGSRRLPLSVAPASVSCGILQVRCQRSPVSLRSDASQAVARQSTFCVWSPASAVSTGRNAPTRARYATAVWDFMLDPFKLLKATAVPAYSRLRPSLAALDGPDSARSPRLRSVRQRRARLLEASPEGHRPPWSLPCGCHAASPAASHNSVPSEVVDRCRVKGRSRLGLQIEPL